MAFKGKVIEMADPKVSVLMSVYNGERYLKEAVESILNQTFRDFEFIIIDDGSTDSSNAIIRSCDDPRVRLIKNEKNIGLTKSLNKGIDLCRGEYIARMDADDISLPMRLEKQFEYARNRKVSVLGTWAIDIDNNGNRISVSKKPTSNPHIKAALLFYNPLIHSSIMIKSELLKRKKYDECFFSSQDYELWIRIRDGHTFENLASNLIMFRWHGDQVSKGSKIEQSDNSDKAKSIYLESVIGDHVFIDDFVEFTKFNVVNVKRLVKSFVIIILVIRRTKDSIVRYYLLRILKDYIKKLITSSNKELEI